MSWSGIWAKLVNTDPAAWPYGRQKNRWVLVGNPGVSRRVSSRYSSQTMDAGMNFATRKKVMYIQVSRGYNCFVDFALLAIMYLIFTKALSETVHKKPFPTCYKKL